MPSDYGMEYSAAKAVSVSVRKFKNILRVLVSAVFELKRID